MSTEQHAERILVFIGNGKGGVGKSTIALGMIDALGRRWPQARIGVVESDTNNPDVAKSINGGGREIDVATFDLADESGWIGAANWVEEHRYDIVVVSGAAKLSDAICRHAGIIDDVATALDMRRVMIWPIDRMKDSLIGLLDWQNARAKDWRTVVVRNSFFGSTWVMHDELLTAGKTRDEVVVWPELSDYVSIKLARDRLPPWGDKTGRLTIAERSSLRQYRNRCGAALEPLFGPIPPAESDA